MKPDTNGSRVRKVGHRMRYGELKVAIEDWEGAPVIRAEGEVDLGTVDALRSAASEVVRRKPTCVTFDLREVSYIDSSGLGVLVATLKRIGRGAEGVIVITSQPAVLQSLHITGLDRVLRIVREPAAAQSCPPGG